MLALLAAIGSCMYAVVVVVVVSYVPTSLPAVQLLIMQCSSDPVRLLLLQELGNCHMREVDDLILEYRDAIMLLLYCCCYLVIHHRK